MEKSSTKDFFSLLGKSSESSLGKLREKTARKLFIILSFIFFLSYFFIGVSFYSNFFGLIISKIYILFVFSGIIFLFFLVNNYVNKILFKIFLWGIILMMLIFSLSPFFISFK